MLSRVFSRMNVLFYKINVMGAINKLNLVKIKVMAKSFGKDQ